MSAFSRLQLAAALLEYDNDPDDPNPSRSAQDSAIFSHIRTRNAPRARTLSGFEHLRETPNLLGVELPRSETASARGSMLAGTRNSRGSIDVLRNPFGDDVPDSERADDDEYVEEDLEVDLEAWGMAGFLDKKEKPSSKNRRTGPRTRQLSKAQSEIVPNAQAPVTDEFGKLGLHNYRQQGGRSMSMGGYAPADDFLESMHKGPIASEADFRRRSLGAPLDPAGRKTPEFRRPLSTVESNQAPLRTHHLDPSHTIPFPTSSPDPRDDEELNTFALPLTSRTSRFDPKAAPHARTMSNASLGSRMALDPTRERTMSNATGIMEENKFALPPPASRISRFDPKIPADARTTAATIGTQGYLEENNPFTLPPPSPTRVSRFDPKVAAHARTISNVSLGSRLQPDADRMSLASPQPLDQDHRRDRPYSRMELMRPKVLVMPSPLQDSEENPAAPQVPVGFQLSTVGPPLPPGAKSAGRPVSHVFPSTSGLQPPNAFTPNPRLSMSLSQLTFRNSLMIGGQRDVAYEDIEGGLRRAREDGEQIVQEDDIQEEIAEEQKQAQGKAPGKLYGRSLMDELEARKEKMRSKQRVFTGDQRPSMMSRGQIRRSSTLIELDAGPSRPVSQAFVDRPSLTRRTSSGSKPLLDFSGETPVSPGVDNGRIPNSKSVFGVDQLWERELAKLKEIEASEKAEEEERKRKDDVKAAKKAKGRSKRKSTPPPEDLPRPSMVADLPPTLPVIEQARRTRPPVLPDSESEPDSEASEDKAKANAVRQRLEVEGWGSSDDEGRRKPRRNIGSDSEDDVPLARKLQLPSIRAPSPDSEDEQPLAKVLERKSMIPDFDFENILGNSHTPVKGDPEEEDDTPLAVRHPRAYSIIARSIAHDDDDDEQPLGLKQAQQQQQAQFQLMAQQQMMMQAQLHNSMAFGAPSMMSGFSPFMVAPSAFNPAGGAPVHDPAKYQSVDKWRHNVATD
ncbi:hypothetical protein K439DRAFT_1662724 [Ramaria rubella]|nr:hypothetical protein K439DRAFT_1662724 [Ramaria rubella]